VKPVEHTKQLRAVCGIEAYAIIFYRVSNRCGIHPAADAHSRSIARAREFYGVGQQVDPNLPKQAFIAYCSEQLL
jgi:hypothetical protein